MVTVRPRPSTPDVAKLARALRTAARRHTARRAAAKQAETQRDRVVRDAHAAGMTPTQIASETGLSAQRIGQICRGGRV